MPQTFSCDSVGQIDSEALEQALAKYRMYLEKECQIHLSGLPIDTETMLRVIELEKLFIPQNITIIPTEWTPITEGIENKQYIKNFNLGDEFSIPASNESCFRAVVFAGPGGGKTTWIKRLISAYGLGKHDAVDDKLPKRELFPILIKGGDIPKEEKLSLFELVAKTLERFDNSFSQCLQQVFIQYFLRHIQQGTALLLIDGLDEIGEESKRQLFFDQIKTFVCDYPKANIIMTSRNVGFKLITQNKFDTLDFTYSSILPFEEEDIRRFCVGWHKVVTPDTPEDRERALSLSKIILAADRIRVLCRTPVLLTTLLLVNRRIGTLPFRRAELYAECIKVLLNTWNGGAFPPIDPRDAQPHLSFVAYYMMFHPQGMMRTIGKSELVRVLESSREFLSSYELSETPEEFIQAVEKRSALLVVRGFHQIGKQLEEVYEFEHLAFQEYLAAYSIVNKHYPEATATSTISESFEKLQKNKLLDSSLREVILLASVLADNWNAPVLSEAIIAKLKKLKKENSVNYAFDLSYLKNILLQMITDGAALSSEDREHIYNACFGPDITVSRYNFGKEFLSLYKSRHGDALRESLKKYDSQRNVLLYKYLIPVVDRHLAGDSDFYESYERNRHTEKHLESINMLDVASWLGYNQPGYSSSTSKHEQSDLLLNTVTRVKGFLAEDCLHDNLSLALASFQALDSLCPHEDTIFSGELMGAFCRIYINKPVPTILTCVKKFPISAETVIWLRARKQFNKKAEIKRQLDEEMNPTHTLGIFLFGILNGIWGFDDVIHLAKGFLNSEDRMIDWDKISLYRKMEEYISVVREADVLREREITLAELYMAETKPLLIELKKRVLSSVYDVDISKHEMFLLKQYETEINKIFEL